MHLLRCFFIAYMQHFMQNMHLWSLLIVSVNLSFPNKPGGKHGWDDPKEVI